VDFWQIAKVMMALSNGSTFNTDKAKTAKVFPTFE